ncbi:uncharacterized protein EV420DRAFT_287073 [Desarmillaria tabescens]|uniref:Uncharacterized protein n=1 Tax=Armillaria tabescens TaxID=1929756 RepID=A0AA39N6Z8_ARMTA|nr:uncharacterized protein EV420DRAFT_287073 [Desarmillaria tabescens]KAK0459739.1 hypothetical protein EV420DRAFT_287073 [Desarmillaria tabescens]
MYWNHLLMLWSSWKHWINAWTVAISHKGLPYPWVSMLKITPKTVLPELEQINSVETLANDRLKVDMVLLSALHEPSVLAKMSAHINELHHWMETNRNHARRIADTLVKHYKSFNFPLNSVSSRIGDLLSEALAIRNKLEEKVECEKKPYTQQSILQKRAASVVRSALEPILADFRVQEENTWQEHKERFWQGLQKCMAPSIEMSEKGNGQLVIMEMET